MDARLPELLARLVLAAVLGAAIGAEREFRQKAAGLRTNALIALGSALFTIVSFELVRDMGGDPSRVASQIVTGIGFLGGGVILRTRGSVHGLTTAATIWMNSAIGVAAGGGWYTLAIAGAVATLVILVALTPLDRYIDVREHKRNRQEPVFMDRDD